MIQAAPLVLSFARAVPMLNKLIGAVGITELGNRVNNYIQENPEESEKIVSMIMPAQGIANALKNKSSEDVEEVQESEIFMNKEKISLEDLDEMTDEEAADLPDEDKAELMKQAGKRRDRELSIATSEKLGLSGPGKEKKDMEYDIDKRYDEGGVEDAPKPKFDYTKFYKNRRRKADGGAIGIEVLFGPKVPAAPSQLVEESEIVLGYRGPGRYQGGRSSRSSRSGPSRGPAGGASAGGNYGGNRNPNQTYGGGGGNNNDGPSGPPRVINPPPKDNKIVKRLKAANTSKLSPFQKFLAHDRFTDMMKVSKTPNYHQMGGLDFMARFPDINPDIAKGLASSYQTIVEGGRAIADGPGGYTLKDARKKAAEEARLNKIGIDDYFDPNSKTYKQYTSEDFGLKPAAVQMADGGRVGFFMGGPALDGQALSIYNSMNAYGFSDQEIANALQEQGLYTPGASTPDPTPDPGQGGSQGRGGDNSPVSLFGENLKSTFTRPAGSKPKLSEDAFFGLGKYFQGKEQGTLGDRRLKAYNNPMLPSFIGGFARKFSPFNPKSRNYNSNMASQLNFLEMGQLGDETGLSLVGYDPGSGLMKYGSDSVLAGKNVISGFGTNNYDTALRNFIAKMQANTKVSDERKKIRIADAEKELFNLQTKSEKGLGRDVDKGGFDPSGPTQRSIRRDRPDKSGSGHSGGFTNPGKGSYGPHMANGGLATMFKKKR